ncbi:hypothetical protein [Geothrix fuzhouensis]|uniref:hypothetical protein n=1 Tax=Geothrix fuzhouensis TaxID=2966451 RepID=UPI002147AA1A|nr:hypothetical protein [Geothrix fuzhouensis]
MNEIQKILDMALSTVGPERVSSALEALLFQPGKTNTLTVICNEGIHSIPENHLHGEVLSATIGNIDLQSIDAILMSYDVALKKVANKLKEKSWHKIYLVTTGPVTLCLQIKMLIYHITRLSTVDIHYQKGRYFEIDMDYRSYLLNEYNSPSTLA